MTVSLVRRIALAPEVALLVSMLLMAGYFVVDRLVEADYPPAGLVFWRSVLATLILLAVRGRTIRAQSHLLRAQ